MSLIPSLISPVLSAAQEITAQNTGIQLAFFYQRNIGGIFADVTIDEDHEDELVITEHPVEQGAVISDHAFRRPARVTVRVGFSNSSPTALSLGLLGLPTVPGTNLFNQIGGFPALGSAAAAVGSFLGTQSTIIGAFGFQYIKSVYSMFVNMQSSRQPISVQTGKRLYRNMLIRRLSTHTDRQYENAMILTVELQEVIVTSTQKVSIPQADVLANRAAQQPTSANGFVAPSPQSFGGSPPTVDGDGYHPPGSIVGAPGESIIP